MVPLLSTLVAALLLVCPGTRANSSYEPYIDAAELYRMQLLANAFQYPGDKLGVDGLGGGVMDMPYGLMGDGRASDRLVDFEDETGSAYWPEELVAELAAATENGEGADSEEDEEVMQPAPIEMAEEKEKQIAEEKEKEEKPEKSQDLKDATKHSGAQLRDQEHLEHSALHGFQSVSGGTVDGQNKQIKTDKALPAYCNPPNPCPVGKTV
ncbi:hypothetical protein EGW08_014099 [Elysia chlorotica]|uniref:Neuroendocrine protein 7B2 n=1 Tax=Elysia chlorotica TaxID=188477 RepID=A0A433T9A6_ELYCH|nr:hypothetical protein EGW08_014099 [Elysia chlorotica]